MTPTISKLQPYSYGVVAANKAPSSFEIEVTPMEDLTMVDGELTANTSKQTAKGTDSAGGAYETTTTQTTTVSATWLPMGSPNRQTPPDVRRGEQVMLYRFADADKYYWVTLRSDLSLRRLETVIFAISAYAGEGQYKPDNDSTYVFGFSSQLKRIWLSTSAANYEPYRYQIELDLANGVFSIWDNIDNAIILDSENHIVRMQNADGSFLELNKNILNSMTAEEMNFKTKKMNMVADDEMNFKTSKWTAEADQINEKAPQRTHEGAQNTVKANQTIAGDWNTTPGEHGNGDATSSGNFHTVGTMKADAGMSTSRLEAEVVHADSYENLP